MRPVIVAGNWKLNHGPRASEAFLDAFLSRVDGETRGKAQVLLFPPAVSLDAARRLLADRAGEPGSWPLQLGIQQIHPEASGAFTGETGAEHAREAGATWALVGHSERRTLFHETDADAVLRVEAALRAGLAPMLCVGERLEEREEGRLAEVLTRQLDAVLAPPALRARIAAGPFALAYEPVWAIGTGRTATPSDASEAHALLRERMGERLGSETADRIPILYGGSVRPDTAGDLLAAPGVDGLLVGGASLDPESFTALVRAGFDAAARR
jgi:triosephosphate isomerase (TIM)